MIICLTTMCHAMAVSCLSLHSMMNNGGFHVETGFSFASIRQFYNGVHVVHRIVLHQIAQLRHTHILDLKLQRTKWQRQRPVKRNAFLLLLLKESQA